MADTTARIHVNPQTTAFCQLLDIPDLMQLHDAQSSRNFYSPPLLANPEEIVMDLSDTDGDQSKGISSLSSIDALQGSGDVCALNSEEIVIADDEI